MMLVETQSINTMKIVEGEAASQMWPLGELTRDTFVGGQSFGELQQREAPSDDVALVSNAWVVADDWTALLAAGEATLQTADGEILAWTGIGGLGGRTITASDASFLVRYSWDLIRLNEQVVSALEASHADCQVIETSEGRLIVGEGTKVLPGVYFEGVIVIGKNCKIGPNCYLRGNTAIGDNCHIGQAVEIKNSVIGHKTSVGHLSYVGDSVLGSGVNFGAGTITSNLRHDGKNHRSQLDGELVETGRRKFGTIVGDGVHTGIHTAIYPGRKIGPGAMTLPGEVVSRDKE